MDSSPENVREKEVSMTRKIAVLILAGLVLSAFLFPQDYGDKHIVSIVKSEDSLKKLSEFNADILMEKEGRIYIIAGYEDFSRLQLRALDYTVENQNFYPMVQDSFSTQGGINGDFHSYPEVERDLLSLESAYPDLAHVSSLGTSLENRNIYALKISDNVYNDEEEAEVLFIGCHHAREWISVEVPYLLAKYLLENYDTEEEVRNLVDRSEIWIVPLLNPDGLEYSIYYYRYWRKNRRDNGDGSFGVDLNRNYGYQWGLDNEGSSSNPDSEIYRGTQSFSEPETQVIRDLLGGHQFQYLISYHSYSQKILYPWGYKNDASDQDTLLRELAKNMSIRMEQSNGRVYDYGRAADSLYTTNGDTTDWSFGTYGIPSYTIELPPMYVRTGEFFNAEEDILNIFYENLEAALYMIDWAIQNAPQFRDKNSTPPKRSRVILSNPRVKKLP